MARRAGNREELRRLAKEECRELLPYKQKGESRWYREHLTSVDLCAHY